MGYRSDILLLPDKRIGLVLASNYDGTRIDEIASGVMDILLGYKPELPKKSVAKEFFKVLEKEGFAAAKSDYFKIVREAKDEFRFTDRELDRLGHYYLEKKDVEKAIGVLKFNVELYPTVSNVYSSLGDAYLAADQKDKAIQNYEKTLELDPKNKSAAEQLKKLKSGRKLLGARRLIAQRNSLV